MLRLACIFATDRGIQVCATVHDAVLIEAPLDDLDDQVKAMQEAMVEASRVVLDGFELRTDATVIRYPDRYVDERGGDMWETVFGLIQELDTKGVTDVAPGCVLTGGTTNTG